MTRHCAATLELAELPSTSLPQPIASALSTPATLPVLPILPGIAAGRRVNRTQVTRQAVTRLPTDHGEFQAVAYHDADAGVDHLALMAASGDGRGADPENPGILVRVHSECLTGEAFRSQKCECGPQLDAALELVHAHGGVVIYLRGHEGRGIGLANKMRAYQLQEQGVDTLDANLQLGFPADNRDYSAAGEILADLGLGQIRLLTNNPDKVDQLTRHGIDVTERVPLLVGIGEHNSGYLAAKRDRMGHKLPDDARLGNDSPPARSTS